LHSKIESNAGPIQLKGRHGPMPRCGISRAALGVAQQVPSVAHRPQAARLLARYRLLVHGARMENLPITLVETSARTRLVMEARVSGHSMPRGAHPSS